MKKLLLLLPALLFHTFNFAQVVINEIMQSNIDCIMDDLNDFPDSWVEIYNGTSEAINLNNYRIGLTDDVSASYRLPSKQVAPQGYAIIYCDKVASGLHTDFRLDSGKGALYLFSNNAIVDKIEKIAKQPAPNIAYGRQKDGDSSFGYQETPTPGAANCGKTCNTVLGNPIFNIPGGVFESPKELNIELTLPEGSPEGTIIRYTMNGSEPTMTSGYTYTEPIRVTNMTRIIRAKLFCDGYLSPQSTVQSYIYLNREQTLPVISIATDPKYLTDSKIGIYTEGNYDPNKKNYEYDWRRPMNIEFYETDGITQSFNQLGEFRIMGAASRGCRLKSLAMYANKRFGEKRFNYEFFPDQRPGQKNYKSFILRNAGNDFDYLYMRDAIIQRTMSSHVDIDWQAWRPAIVFINGSYKGILNIRERSSDDNIFTNYNELEDIDMIENSWELKNGTWDKYNAFKDFYAEHGHTMEEYSKWLDVYEFLNIYAMNLFFNNRDWPGNNTVWWRPRTDDGVFRIIAKDTDFGLGLYDTPFSYNTLAWLHDPNYDPGTSWANQYDHTRLFRRLTEDSDFQREFVERCAIYMADFLNERGIWEIWEPMYNMIKTEYPIHRKLFNEWWPNYNEELNKAHNWIKQRPEYFYKHLAERYSLGTPIPFSVVRSELSEDDAKRMLMTANGVTLSGTTLNGKFFKGHKLSLECRPLTAEELAAKGIDGEASTLEVIGWNVITNGSTQFFDTKTLDYVFPETSSVTIIPVYEQSSGIEEINSEATDTDASAHTIESIYDISGRKSVGARHAGIYIQRKNGQQPHKIIMR